MDAGVIKAANILYNQEYGLQFDYSINEDGTLVVNITLVDDLPLITKNLLRTAVRNNIDESLKYFPKYSSKDIGTKIMGSKIIFNGEEIDYNFIYENENLKFCKLSLEDSLKTPVISNSRISQINTPTARDYTYDIQTRIDSDYYTIDVLMSPKLMTFNYIDERIYVTEDKIKDFCNNSEYALDEEVTYEECCTWFVSFFNYSALEGEQNTAKANQFYNCITSIGFNSNSQKSLYYDFYPHVWLYMTSIGNIESSNPYDFPSDATYPGIIKFIEYFNK